MIYFIRRGDDGPVKIGFTTNLDKRLAALQNGNAEKLTVIRTMEGDEEAERVLHGYFADLRLQGEWFEYSEEMMSVEAPAYVAPPVENPTETSLARRIADALRADFGHLKAMHRAIAEITDCTEDGVKNWTAGRSTPAVHHFLNLARVAPSVRAILLEAMGEEDTPETRFKYDLYDLVRKHFR